MRPGESPPRPEDVFADWLKSLDAEREADIEALCALHPDAARVLRALHADWLRLRPVLPRPQAVVPVADELAKRFGAAVDPEISLDAEPAPEQGSSSTRLMHELASRGSAASRYRLLGEIARGGMGAILRVWDQDLRRHLAMKVVLGRDEAAPRTGTPPVDPRQLARFLEEAQITAQLDHPGVVPVHELGLAADGRVYFTMRLVKGRDLKQVFELAWRGEEGWSIARALSAVLRACEALGYAHAKGVVHRDLKPANVMVGRHGEVYVMDWGLARVVDREDRHDIRLATETTALSEVLTARGDDASDSPLRTMDGAVVGTPTYMSPEQARGRVAEVGPRSDVYSIGAMLYHLLARTAPFVPAGERVSQRAVLARLIEGPPRPLVELAPDAPEELVAICEKAMARDAKARYADVGELAEDLRAYLENRVVRAHRTGAVIELKKWVARNRGIAAAIAAALVIAIGGLAGVSIVQAGAARRERAMTDALAEKHAALAEVAGDLGEAEVRLARTEQMLDDRIAELERVDHERRLREANLQAELASQYEARLDLDRQIELRNARLEEVEQHIAYTTYRAAIAAAAASIDSLDAGDARRALDECNPSLRGWEWRYLAAASDNSVATLGGHTSGVLCIDVSPDGGRIASGSLDKTVRVWDTEARECIQVLRGHDRAVGAVRFSRDGRWFASGSDDGAVIVWNVATWEPVRTIGTRLSAGRLSVVRALDFDPRGSTVAAAGFHEHEPPSLGQWEVASGALVRSFDLDGDVPRCARFSGDGRALAVIGGASRLQVFDVVSAARKVHTPEVADEIYYALSFTPRGDRIACGSIDSIVRVLDVANGATCVELRGHESQVLSVAFHPEGRTLASGSTDRTVILWDVESAAPSSRLVGHSGDVWGIDFSPDGSLIASASSDETVRLWDPSCAAPRTTFEDRGSDATFSADGRYLVSPGNGATAVGICDLVAGASDEAGIELPEFAYAVLIDPRSRWIVFGGQSGDILVWDWRERRERARLHGHSMLADAMATNADGSLLVTGSRDDSIRVWDMRELSLQRVLSAHTDDVTDVAISADGERILSASADGTVGIWDTASGERVHVLLGHEGPVLALALDEPRGQVVSAGADRTLRFWDTASGALLESIRADDSGLYALALHPDGSRLAVGNEHGTVRIWDLDRRERLFTLRVAVADAVGDLQFSPDGARLAVAFWGSPTVVFDSTPAAERHRIRREALAAREASSPVPETGKK